MSTERKARIPDEKGEWQIVGEKKKVNISKDNVQQKLQKAQEEDFFSRVGACTDALNKFLALYANDHNLTPEETMAAVYLENINNREFYPGGIDKFNSICGDVWGWFQQHK